MDLIYATADRTDIGILKDYDFDLAYGASENDFELTLELSKHCCKDDYIIYMTDTENGMEEPTEYGGIIDTISVDTSAGKVTYGGRTWHGILSEKVIEPESGQDYKVVTGDASDIIRELIGDAGLSGWFTVAQGNISVPEYRFRYKDLYSGITEMLAANGGKLQVRYAEKMVVLTPVWLVDYSQDDEWDSSQVDFKISQNKNPLNHLICLGQGNLKNRAVIHLFTDENGGVQPYATADDPVKDSDYILDTQNQVLFGTEEVAETYDNSSAGTVENYVVMTTQPSDWGKNYSSYYVSSSDGSFSAVESVETETLTVLTSQPSDWSSRYNAYYTSDGKTVAGVATESYEALSAKPADWEKNYASYYVHFWDGTQYLWQGVSGVTWKEYIKQTQAPSDWQTNYGSYYKRQNVYKITKNKQGKVIKKVKVGVGYVAVSKVKKGKKEVVPTWAKNKYYTMYSHTKAPSYTSGLLPKYKQVRSTVAPTWASGTYYTKTRSVVAPAWKTKTYYTMYEDHYAELVRGGIERLKEASDGGDSISINLSLLGEYDVGDIVGAIETTTGISVWQAITKKIINIKNNQKTISYQIGANE